MDEGAPKPNTNSTNRSIEENELIDVSILLAEDNKNNREILVEALGFKYSKVEGAETAEKLIEKFSTPGKSFDIVISDNNFGSQGMTGLQAIEEIRKTKPEIPIILITALPEAIKEEVKRLKINCILTKPFGIEDLENAIEKIRLESQNKPIS